MGIEIERKFLLLDGSWRASSDGGTPIRQGFLSTDRDRVVRVRVYGTRGFLTVKGRSQGAARAEFEWPIPLSDAEEMLDTLALKPLIEKTRHLVEHAGHTWEIDVFGGRNSGLIVAEVELDSVDEVVQMPPWAGAEVTDDSRYTNARLAHEPFDTWG